MDDLLGYLVLALFIGFSVFSEIRKKAKEKKSVPHPDSHPSTFESSLETKTSISPPQNEKRRDHYRPLCDNTSTMPQKPQPSKNCMEDQSDVNSSGSSPYTISSAEEARRAIIWSEVFRRKY